MQTAAGLPPKAFSEKESTVKISISLDILLENRTKKKNKKKTKKKTVGLFGGRDGHVHILNKIIF